MPIFLPLFVSRVAHIVGAVLSCSYIRRQLDVTLSKQIAEFLLGFWTVEEYHLIANSSHQIVSGLKRDDGGSVKKVGQTSGSETTTRNSVSSCDYAVILNGY